MIRPLSRRAVLRGACGITVGLPFLSAMLAPRRSWAAGVPKRLVVFFSSCGTLPDRWRPSGGERDFALSDILAPLQRHRDELIIVEGVDQKTALHASGGQNGHDIGTGHSLTPLPLLPGKSGFGEFGHLWDGSAGGTSFDQHVADSLGEGYAFSSLVFGAKCDIRQAIPARISWRGPFDAVRPMQEPGAAYDRVFGGGVEKSTSVADVKAQRLSVVDAVLDDYHRLYARLGADDRRRVEAHLESLRGVERSIEALESLADCALPERVDGSEIPQVGSASLDMMVAAMACELTPVTVMQWGSGQSTIRHSWLGQSTIHHSLSHEPDSNATAQQELLDINHWYAEQLAGLLDRMTAVDVGDGSSLLDNSVVLWCNELGIGNTHTRDDVPYVLAGKCGGALSTGRYLDLRSDPDVAHGELFTALLHALDIEADHFGMPEYCRGPLSAVLT
ncbi:MAG: DUF1552 domain-containing protein [Myxococcales bacterium]|nr:DUF1552 domain-containing protein [Myxococcales bacterium]